MTTPQTFIAPEPLEARLVTKTSLPEPKKAISLLVILWCANDKPDAVEYGKNSNPQKEGGILDDTTTMLVEEYAKGHDIKIDHSEAIKMLSGNPLFESQMESLNSAFELIWHLGSFTFADASLNRGAERTGGIRYRKQIRYTTNLDIIDVIGSSNPDAFARVLFNWLSGGKINSDRDMEHRLIRALAVFAESSLFKTSKGENGKVFALSGIYDALLDGNKTVDIVDPGEEVQGTTRILKPAIGCGLNPMLESSGSGIARAEGIDEGMLRHYSNRAKTGIGLSNVKVNLSERGTKTQSSGFLEEPRNWIYFGAPGTGKSFELNRLAVGDKDAGFEGVFDESNVRRVTFYPDYTYSQFVGCFKPCTRYAEQAEDEPSKTEKPYVSYEFVPGPFLDTYVKAVQNPQVNYLLIIEEINRANPAAVFGDVFQLLDRDDDGRSVYEIAVPREMENYLKVFMPEYASSKNCPDPSALLAEKLRLQNEATRLSLPPNMYIWATMNSADQGVFPMDTAFKRRWDFRYIGIDAGEKEVADKIVKIAGDDGPRKVKWNDLRHSINKLLLESAGVNEDKLIGPFFIAPDALDDGDEFGNLFKEKILLYLYEDAGKTKHRRLFSRENATYSQVCDDFDSKGIGAFAKEFQDFEDAIQGIATDVPGTSVKTTEG